MKLNPALIACALGLLTFPLWAEDKPVRDHLTFETTISPNGAYAVAWSCPTLSKGDWASIVGGEEVSDSLFDTLVDEAENSLVDLKSGRKIADLSSDYFSLPSGMSPNRKSLDVAWSSSSDLVVVLQGLRFDYGVLEAVQLSTGGKAAGVNIGAQVEAGYRKHLASSYPEKYKRDKEDISISFDELKALGGREFSMGAYAFVPKSADDEKLDDHSSVRFTLTNSGGELKLQVQSVKTAPDEDSPEEAQKQLDAADKKLNAEYRLLRAALDEQGREALKQEQLAWLKKRDEITDVWQKSRFVDTRAEEFKARRANLKK